ncbi:DNA repair protein RecN [Sporosalibacterium faouarense]|uniref:DNA repair protein RecN n=1 Tax=Sporosalibacterium faouarense TaxID=516123 RepID=UPI00141CD842|nr:DNA repair protein RecN [Sporosalibacterium faouarense]MTI48186.1 DNA repair protein RecN [Bacillota bacterium]
MLLELNIENFAIIDNVNIHFSDGFNVLTGETGAGKSIIIDAVSMVLGGRAAKEFIRTGADKSVIEAVFSLKKTYDARKTLKHYGIDVGEDNTLIVTREIYSTGRSVSRVNGRTVTLNMLKELTDKLVDIHGQHEHQSLLNQESHINFIDSLGKNIISDTKENILKDYNKVKSLKSNLGGLAFDEQERERKIDLLKFQLNEIDEAELKPNEEEKLMNNYKKISNVESIKKSIGSIIETMNSSDYNQVSVLDKLNSISGLLVNASKSDDNIEKYKETFDSAIYQLQEVVRDLRDYEDTLEYNPEKLQELEDRIAIITRLKRKYGNTIEEILQYRDDIDSELQSIINSEKEIIRINNEIKAIEKQIYENCYILTKERKKIAAAIEKDITKELKELNMPNVTFKISFKELDTYTKTGIDNVEFLISTNIGEPVKSLSKIVSGGEMSRIMLAFKTILAHVDHISCLIFDEIDTGISGRTAQVISEKIAEIARTHQVLCITHLPQIAAMSDTHFQISKVVHNRKTNTRIKKLTDIDRINELSRLLGGVDLTSTTKMHAKEMLEMSEKIKRNWK